MVVKAILDESRDHYQLQYDQTVARLLHIPKGSLRPLIRDGRRYWYLRRFIPPKGYKDLYLGRAGNNDVEHLITFIGERKRKLDELRAIKAALKELGVKHVELQAKGYPGMFTRLLEAFGQAGLWNEGLMLIGSWCFNVYVQAFGVAHYPLRTMDFDFGLRVPYTGDKANIHDMLSRLGFTPRIDMAYDKVDYVLPGVGMVEVFIDRAQASREQLAALKSDLVVRPAAISFLDLLVDNPVTVAIHGVHKAITLPSMPAFFIHRLITASHGEYRDAVLHQGKIRKDYKQAALVAMKIAGDPNLRRELDALTDHLSEKRREMMLMGAAAAREWIKAPDLSEEEAFWIQKVMNF